MTFANQWSNYLSGLTDTMPPILQDLPEVPMPDGVYVCLSCQKVNNYWKTTCEECEYDD